MFWCNYRFTVSSQYSERWAGDEVYDMVIMSYNDNHNVFAGVSRWVPDNSMAQFQKVMRQQLESSMHAELENLLSTAKGDDAEVGTAVLSLNNGTIFK